MAWHQIHRPAGSEYFGWSPSYGQDSLDNRNWRNPAQVGHGVPEWGAEMISEHDRVVLISDIVGEAVRAGDVGTVVHIYPQHAAYEVEFFSLDGQTFTVATVERTLVRPVNGLDVAHARTVAASA
jgi:hypothetical protein